MHDTGTTWTDDASVPEMLRGGARALASKCDLCHTSSAGPACVRNCPHHCAFRIGSVEEFQALERRDRSRTEVLSVDSARFRPSQSTPGAGPAPAEGLVVVFQNRGQTCPFKPGQTLLEVAEAGGVAMKVDCRIGICGSDPVRVLSGQEHLDPTTDEERDTLEDICKVDPATHRMACRARPTGPVVVEIVDRD